MARVLKEETAHMHYVLHGSSTLQWTDTAVGGWRCSIFCAAMEMNATKYRTSYDQHN